MKWSAVKHWANHTQLWSILVLVSFVGGIVMLEVKDDRNDLRLISALLRGEQVKVSGSSGDRVRYLMANYYFDRNLLEAGFSQMEIDRLRAKILAFSGCP